VNWRWLDRHAIELLHAESLAEHGGREGTRSQAALDSALSRARNLLAYGKPDFADLAAAYGAGIVANHPFVDGNKHAGFLGVGLLLALNGYRLEASQSDAALTIYALAAGQLDERALAAWIRAHARRKG
jgi:death-on-curing protein